MAGMAGLGFGARPSTTQSRQLAELYAAQKGTGQPRLSFQNPANAPPGKMPMPTSNAGTWANTGTVVKPAMAAAPPPQAGLTSPGDMVSSLRPQPNPQAGLNEKPAQGRPDVNTMMQGFLAMLFGPGKAGGLNLKMPAPPPAQAPVQEAAPNKFDRASRLFGIGAELL